MKIKLPYTICAILIVNGFFAQAQELDQRLEGRVFSTTNDVSSVHVSNLNLNRGTITDASGFFSITVRLGDTLAFSAVQFKQKKIPITKSILEVSLFLVPLEDMLTELNEVVVTPYNLSGELNRDMGNMKIDPVVTASTLGLPNAYAKLRSQSERRLLEAKDGAYLKPLQMSIPLYAGVSIDLPAGIAINLKRILNDMSGRNKMLKEYIVMDKEIELLRRVKGYYPDSVYVQEFKISEANLDEFWYFCEADAAFDEVVRTDDKLKLWEFLRDKSEVYRRNSGVK